MMVDVYTGTVAREPQETEDGGGVIVDIEVGSTQGQVYHDDLSEISHLSAGDEAHIVCVPGEDGTYVWHIVNLPEGQAASSETTPTEDRASAAIARIYRRLLDEEGVGEDAARRFASTVFINLVD